MSIETDLRAALSGIAGGRVYPLHLPQTPTYPAVSYFAVGGERQWSLSGSANLRQARIQVDTWATTYADAKTTMDSIRTQIAAASTFQSVPLTDDEDFYEDETGLYRASADFSVWQ